MDSLKILNDLFVFMTDLRIAVLQNDSANVVRSCSHVLYCISDLLEDALPDGVSITIK